MYNQLDGLVINKPFGLIGKALEQRSQIRDGLAYRDYLSVDEALANLTGESPEHTAAIRTGHAPVYVTPLAGPTKSYWFINGTQDTDLKEIHPAATLQQITDAGNSTTSAINADGGYMILGNLIFNYIDNGNVIAGINGFKNHTTGYNNIAIGRNTMEYNTDGNLNTALGLTALWHNISGGGNIAVGEMALGTATTACHTIAIGTYALSAHNYQMVLFPGGSADSYNVRPSIAIGKTALMSNTTGYWNLAIGIASLYWNVTGYNNTAIGHMALGAALGTDNTALGIAAGRELANGDRNIFIGSTAGIYQTNGSDNIAIGCNTSLLYPVGSGQLNIGNKIYGDQFGNIGIGNLSPTEKLDVNGNVYVNGNIGIEASNGGGLSAYEGGVAYMQLGFSTMGAFGGGVGIAGRSWYLKDFITGVTRLGVNAAGDLFIGESPSVFDMAVHKGQGTEIKSLWTGQLKGIGAIPTVVAGPGAGTTPGVQIPYGHSLSFRCNITPGADPVAAPAIIATITLPAAMGGSTPMLCFAARSYSAAEAHLYFDTTDSTITIRAGLTLLTGVSYNFDLTVIDY